MNGIEQLFRDMGDWLTAPFKRDLSFPHLAMVIVVYIIIAIALYDSVKILGQWMAHAAETATA